MVGQQLGGRKRINVALAPDGCWADGTDLEFSTLADSALLRLRRVFCCDAVHVAIAVVRRGRLCPNLYRTFAAANLDSYHADEVIFHRRA